MTSGSSTITLNGNFKVQTCADVIFGHFSTFPVRIAVREADNIGILDIFKALALDVK